MHFFLIVGTATSFGFCLSLAISNLRRESILVAAIVMAIAGSELGLLIAASLGISA